MSLKIPRDYIIAYGFKAGWKKWRSSKEYKKRLKSRKKKEADKKKRAQKRIKQARRRI